MEVMAGTAIVAMTAAVGTASATHYLEDQKISITMDEMKQIHKAVEQYHVDNPQKTFSTFTTSLVNNDYLPKLFTDVPNSDWETDWSEDAFGNDYNIVKPTVEENGLLTSCGPDGMCFEDLDAEEQAEFPDADKDNIVMELPKIIT